MSTPITATTIAAIAGVSVTAVGQWRHRDETFPPPLDPTVRPITFDQDAVLSWLTATGRAINLPDAPSRDTTGQTPMGRDRINITLRTAIDRLRSVVNRDQFTATLTLFAAQRHIDDANVDKTTIPEPLAGKLDEMLTDTALREAYELTAGLTAADILDHLDSREQASKTDAMHGSPQVVNDLLASLAPDDCHSIIDVVCGSGGTLDALHHRFPDAALSGNDIDEAVLVMAQTRALASGWSATWSQHNALASDCFAAGTFDLVCSVPPWGTTFDKKVLDTDPQRWPYGVPSRTDDTAWLQLAHHLLADNGTAIIVLPSNRMAKRPVHTILRDMTPDYSLQAVIELPGQMHYGTSVSTMAFVIAKNPATLTDGVFFARIDDEHVTRDKRKQVTAVDIDPIASALAAHRAGNQIDSTAMMTQVNRLDLLRADSTFRPSYWVNQANARTPDDLQRGLTTAVEQITSIDGVGTLVDPLVITDDRAPVTTAKSLPSVRISHPRSGADKDSALRVGDICIGLQRATVCTVDGERPDRGGYIQVVRCDAEEIDPWFFAAVLSAALLAGSATESSVIPRLDLGLVDVPVLSIDEQRSLGALYRDTVNKQKLVEQQAIVWGHLSSEIATSIASGLASMQD